MTINNQVTRNNLRAIRISAGLSLSEAARRLCVDKAWLSRVERKDNYSPMIETLIKFSKFYGVATSEIINGL